MKYLTLIFLTLLSIGTQYLQAQNNFIYTEAELLKSNDIEAEIQDFKAQLVKNKKDPSLYLGLGFCYLFSADSKYKAIAELTKAVSLLEAKKETQETDYLKAQILLGQAYRMNMRFSEAKEYFKEIMPQMKEKTLNDFVKREIQLCENGEYAMLNPDLVSIMNMRSFNSKYSDHSPMMIDNQSVVFTAKIKSRIGDKKEYNGEYPEDVYISKLSKTGEWSEPKPFSSKLKMKDNISNCGISRDGKTLYFYYAGDIHESVKSKKGKWSKLKKTSLPVNTKYEEKHISFSKDGKTAYFVSNRPGGPGGYDIYKIEKQGQNWSKPVLLGKEINTPYDDHSPNITPDGTLFFSSKGHNSMGGYDIFKALPDGKGGFQKAQNLGWPTNSVDDDIFYFPSEDKQRAFFTSARTGGRGSYDIYLINYHDFLMVSGNTIKKGGETAGITHQVFKLEDKSLYEKPNLQANGNYNFLISRNNDFFASAEAEGYYFETFTFRSADDSRTEQEVEHIVLQPVTDSPDEIKQYTSYCGALDNKMNLFLNTLVRFLEQNPERIVDISIENDDLSEQIIDFLKEYGIKDKQISTHVYEASECTFTIYKKQKEIAVKAPEKTETFETYKPEKTVYTIQVGAFRRELPTDHWFFKNKRGMVQKRDGIDGLHRYSDGIYNTREEAEAALPKYKAIFYDAFIREIKWYDDLNAGKTIQ